MLASVGYLAVRFQLENQLVATNFRLPRAIDQKPTTGSAVGRTVDPIARAPCLVRNGEDDDSIALGAIENRKRKIFQDNATSTRDGWGPGERKGKSSCGSLLDSAGKASTEVWLCLVVVRDLRQKLPPRLRNKPRSFH